MKQYKKRSRTGVNFIKASHILETVISKNFTKKGFEDRNLLFQWNDIVGEGLSKVTRPLKIIMSRDLKTTTLRVQVNRAYAPQISLSLEQIKAKVNQFFGYEAISRIVIQQGDPSTFKSNSEDIGV